MNCSSHPSNNENQKETITKESTSNQNTRGVGVSEENDAGLNESLSWDDDAFEIEKFDKALEGVKSGVDAKRTSQCEAGSKKEENEDGDIDDEDWLTPLDNEPRAAKNSSHDGHGQYLTRQFRSLDTPVSRKKSRCTVCTRPVSEGTGEKLCPRCINDRKKEAE